MATIVGCAVLCAGAACAGPSLADHPPTSSGATSLLPRTPDALPAFDLSTFERLLAQIRGEPVVVNVWASWCGPCVEEAPDLSSLARSFAGRVQFVGVDYMDAPAAARDFIRTYRIPYPSVADASGSIRNGLGFIGQPITQVYLADGRKDPRGLWFSSLDRAKVAAELRRVTGS